jgi:hypothetical protein
VGIAAHLCSRYGVTPRELGRDHIRELQDLAGEITGCGHVHLPSLDGEPALTARAVAERHAQDLVDGELDRARRDLYGRAATAAAADGLLPTDPSAWEVLAERPNIEFVDLDVRYATADGDVDLSTRWQQVAGRWRIVEATSL